MKIHIFNQIFFESYNQLGTNTSKIISKIINIGSYNPNHKNT